MDDIQDIFSNTLGNILTDFQISTTATSTPNPAYKSKKNAKARKAKVQVVSTNTPKTPANSPKIAQKPIDNNEFDLRKAVIYSEILTPKFKDYEF